MESISRISSLLETARDLTIEAARDAGAVRKAPPRATPPAQLKKLLDSRVEREVLDGLRRVISMMYRSQPTLPFFSSVIKNVASPSLEVKKLVYIYLLHHAEAEPDTALLSINTIQKSLSDSNPQIRALALRVMSGIRVPVISQIVSLGIKKGVGDMSPYVRKAAAFAIPKCYRLDPNTLPQLLDYLSALLGDRQYYVAGAAVAAFLDICPERLDLIHPHYRGLVRKLVDMDEWGQLATIRLLIVYARKCFPQRTRKVKVQSEKTKKATKGFYSDSEGEEDGGDGSDVITEKVFDPDLELFISSLRMLLQSRSSAVVLAVAKAFYYLYPGSLNEVVGPLVSLLRGPPTTAQIALHNIVHIALTYSTLFLPYYTRFLIHTADPPYIYSLKLEMISLIFPHATPRLQSLLLSDLSHFSQSASAEPSRATAAIRAIGRCATNPDTSPSTRVRCMRLLLTHVGSPDPHLAADSLDVIRLLIQREPDAHRLTVVKLAKHLDAATSPHARACIIWLVGELAGLVSDPQHSVAADVLRILLKGFASESEAAKLQILLLSARVYLHHLNATRDPSQLSMSSSMQTSSLPPLEGDEAGFREQPAEDESNTNLNESIALYGTDNHPITRLWEHTQLLARYDTSYDLRDRARVYRALLAIPTSTELATLLLLAPKPIPQAPSPSEASRGLALGSASLIVGEEGGVGGLRGYEDVPDWVKAGREPDPKLRNTEDDNREQGTVSAGDRLDAGARAEKAAHGNDVDVPTPGSAKGVGEKSLDDWLAEDDDGEEEESSEESEYETDEEEDDEEDDESEDDEEDEEDDEEEESSDDDGEQARLVK